MYMNRLSNILTASQYVFAFVYSTCTTLTPYLDRIPFTSRKNFLFIPQLTAYISHLVDYHIFPPLKTNAYISYFTTHIYG